MKNVLLKKNGNTNDIINGVLLVYSENWNQTNEIANKLKDENIIKTLNNIFDFVDKNIIYKEDFAGVQWIKTPKRLLIDKTGDCKSFAIFIASCLKSLNIDFSFRFVSFSNQKIATHVYIVAHINGKNYILDPVAKYNGNSKFNYQVPYNYKLDIKENEIRNNMKGTNIFYLSGINATKSNKIWLNRENEKNITIGKKFIYLKIDEFVLLYNTAKTRKDKEYYFKKISLWTVLLWCYEFVKGETFAFRKISKIVSSFSVKDIFSSVSQNQLKGEKDIIEIFENIKVLYSQKSEPTRIDLEFSNLVESEIILKNKVENFKTEKDVDVLNKLYEIAPIFAYMYLDENKLKRANLVENYEREKGIKKYNEFLQNSNYTPEFYKTAFKNGFIKATGKNPETLTSTEISNELRKLKIDWKKVYEIARTVLTVLQIVAIIL